MVACAICGKENPAGVEYCEDCGAALPGSAGATSVPAEADPFGREQEAGGGEPSVASAPAPGDSATASSASPVPAGDSAAPALINPRLAWKRYGAITAEEIPLQGDHLVVGRFDPETGPVDIDLSAAPEAGQLSRHHAELYREASGAWYVKDLGSTNGVFVKRPDSSTFGPRVTTPTVLSPGDEVAFGNARFIFKAD